MVQPNSFSADGHCECLAGYRGKFCREQCEDGYFGLHCLKQCTCAKTSTDRCDHINGHCFCRPGFKGDNCTQVSSYATCPLKLSEENYNHAFWYNHPFPFSSIMLINSFDLDSLLISR